GITFDDTLKLRDYPTLNHVVAFVRERAGLGEPAAGAKAEPAPAATPSAAEDPTERILAIVAEETGYPSDLLDLDLDLEADLGIDTVKQAGACASTREAYASTCADPLKLRASPPLTPVVAFVRERAGLGEPAA